MFEDDSEYGKIIRVKANQINVRGKNKRGGFIWWTIAHQIDKRADVIQLDRRLRGKIVKIYKIEGEIDIFIQTIDGSIESLE